jgi:hypothetical protein
MAVMQNCSAALSTIPTFSSLLWKPLAVNSYHP